MGGRCAGSKGPPAVEYPPERPRCAGIERPQMWAVIDKARVMMARARSSRPGSASYDLALDALELELARLPEWAWEK